MEWHSYHIKAKYLAKTKMEVGAKLYVEESIQGKSHKFTFTCTKIELNREIKFKNSFPISLICSKGSFLIEPKGNSCIFTAILFFRWRNFLSKIAKARVELLQNCMREEGENLK